MPRTCASLSFFAASITAAIPAGSLLCDNAKITCSRTFWLGSLAIMRFNTSTPCAPREVPNQNAVFSRTRSGWLGDTKSSSARSAAGPDCRLIASIAESECVPATFAFSQFTLSAGGTALSQ